MNYNFLMDIAPGEERVSNDIEEDGTSIQTPQECDEITNNISLPSGGHFIRIIGEDQPVFVQSIGPYVEPMDEGPQFESARVPRYSRSLIMQNRPDNVEQNRYESFRGNWPRNSPVSADNLARAGFKFIGPNDRVKCVFCNGVLSRWAPSDNPFSEHRKHFPNCLYVLGRDVNNIPYKRHISTIERTIPARLETTLVRPSNQSVQQPKHPQYRIKSDRLVTFNDWPSQIRQKPEDFADAGLFYLGHGDKVKCFFCDGMLHSWEPNDEPMIEHAKWFPDCEYVQLIMGKEFINDVKSGKITSMKCPVQKQNNLSSVAEGSVSKRSENVENNAAVQAVLEQGNTMEQIKTAFEKLGIRPGEDIPKAEMILQAIMQIEYTDCRNKPQKEYLTMTDPESGSTEYNSLMEENRNLREQRLCKICLENEVTIIFLPCGHVCCCAECSISVKICPICRHDISSRVKAFLA